MLSPSGSASFSMERPSSTARGEVDKVEVKLDLVFSYSVESPGPSGEKSSSPISSLRRCRVCRQESVNGEAVRETCRSSQVRRIVEE